MTYDSPNNVGSQTEDGNCNALCVGNDAETCGAAEYIYIYAYVPVVPETITSSTVDFYDQLISSSTIFDILWPISATSSSPSPAGLVESYSTLLPASTSISTPTIPLLSIRSLSVSLVDFYSTLLPASSSIGTPILSSNSSIPTLASPIFTLNGGTSFATSAEILATWSTSGLSPVLSTSTPSLTAQDQIASTIHTTTNYTTPVITITPTTSLSVATFSPNPTKTPSLTSMITLSTQKYTISTVNTTVERINTSVSVFCSYKLIYKSTKRKYAPTVTSFLVKVSSMTTKTSPLYTTLYSVSTTTTSSPVPQCTSTLAYTIQAGDTFNALAASFGISVSSLEAANPNYILTDLQIGAILTVPQTCASLYTIQAGDTFNLLSAKFGVSVAILEAANPNDVPTDLQIGATLIIPGPPGPERWYIIQAGDTFNSIAASFGVDVALLEAANPDDVPTDLQIGSILLIPEVVDPNAVERKLNIRSGPATQPMNQLAMLSSVNATSSGQRLRSLLQPLFRFWKG